MIIEPKKCIFHNPDNLTISQIDLMNRGWRLLLPQELNTLPAYPKNDSSIEIWNPKGEYWDTLSDFHHHPNRTYRTKRPM